MKVLHAVAVAIAALSITATSISAAEGIYTDLRGTRVLVKVDWTERTVYTRVLSNPAGLEGTTLEERIQVAVLHAGAVGCSLATESRTVAGNGGISGQLDCPWFRSGGTLLASSR